MHLKIMFYECISSDHIHQKMSHKSFTLKQSEHTLKIDDHNLRLSEVNSDSEQEHNNPSHQCAEASAASKDERF